MGHQDDKNYIPNESQRRKPVIVAEPDSVKKRPTPKTPKRPTPKRKIGKIRKKT